MNYNLLVCEILGGAVLYKIQIVDTNTQETLIDEDHNDLDFISKLFRTSTNPDIMDCIIMDSKNRARSCVYDSHSIIKNGEDTIYRIFFKMKLVKERV